MSNSIATQAGFKLMAAGLALAAGLVPAAAQQELRIGLLSPMTGFSRRLAKT